MMGFHQILVGERTIPLTAFCTPSGLYEWLVMPQGTSGSPDHFQRIINRITAGLQAFMTVYMDDALVRSKDETTMVDYVELSFEA